MLNIIMPFLFGLNRVGGLTLHVVGMAYTHVNVHVHVVDVA